MGVLCAEGGEASLADMGLFDEGRHPYNEGLLVLLPKKTSGDRSPRDALLRARRDAAA